MKKIYLAFAFICCTVFVNAQIKNASVLSQPQLDALFTEEVMVSIDMPFTIYKVFSYKDITGKYYLALTESMDKKNEKDTSSKNIKALLLKDNNGIKSIVEINDNITPTLNEEFTISFWTKYMSFEKVGNIIIPIIVYGTKGMNNYMDGRIKIIILYNNKKIIIRHQNAVLDGERVTTIDKAFYTLPIAIQNVVKQKITAMENAEHAILGNDWKNEMKKKKTEIKG
jgi:hypothetical protein